MSCPIETERDLTTRQELFDEVFIEIILIELLFVLLVSVNGLRELVQITRIDVRNGDVCQLLYDLQKVLFVIRLR